VKNRRDLYLLIGLLAVLVTFTVLGVRRDDDDALAGVPTTHSSGDAGALALLRWLGELGYDAQRLEYRPFELGEGDAALIVLSPSEPYNRTEVDATLKWVEDGGTLIVADDRPALFGGGNALLRELDIRTAPYSDTARIERAPAAQPALDQPPVRDALVRADRVLEFESPDFARLLGPPDATVLAGIKRGAGYVYVSSSALPFTNDGLRDEGNAALLLNLLRRVRPEGRVLFDEYHHGFFTPPSLRTRVLGSAWGWALIGAVALTAAFVVLSGRRFGRPVPLREETARRSSAEYVESMADLFQRGGKRAFVLAHYRAALKRRLARPFGINPRLDDDAFVRELARFRPVDEAALAAQLARLRRERLSEDELVRVVAESDDGVSAVSQR
jgi:hypothetical protein